MKYIKNKLRDYQIRIVEGFKYALKKQLQLTIRFILAFIFFSLVLLLFQPNPVQFSITPQFKIIEGEYKTTLWNHKYHQKICSQQKNNSQIFWTQQCIFSNLELPIMKSNIVTVCVTELQYKSINTVKLCRFISSINKQICQQRYVQDSQVQIKEIDLEDVIFISISLRLKENNAYFSNPTIYIHTNPNIIILLIHKFYLIFCFIMCLIFGVIISLALILKDIYYYQDLKNSKQNEIVHKQQNKPKEQNKVKQQKQPKQQNKKKK